MANFFRLCIVFLFRLLCWCLVTSSFSPPNCLFGGLICILIPFGDFKKLQIRTLLPEVLMSLRLPFDMLKESIELMMVTNPKDTFVVEKVSLGTRMGSKFAEFMDLFRITFTPMSLVVRRSSDNEWLVHQSLDASTSVSTGSDR